MEIESKEWLSIGRKLCESKKIVWKIDNIIQHHYGLSNKMYLKITRFHNYYSQIRHYMDSILGNYYPRDTIKIPNTNIDIISVFYKLADDMEINNIDIYKDQCEYKNGKCIHLFKKSVTNKQKIFINENFDYMICCLNDTIAFLNNNSIILKNKIKRIDFYRKKIQKYINIVNKEISFIKENI